MIREENNACSNFQAQRKSAMQENQQLKKLILYLYKDIEARLIF